MILENQRVVIGMIDGFGMDYYEQNELPALKSMSRQGLFNRVSAVYPTVTNTNNVSICCGAWPSDHGITGNSYFDEGSGTADNMESSEFIRVPTILERAAKRGIPSALLTCKNKTIRLLSQGSSIAVAAEDAPADFTERYGKPAHVYSREINYWLWEVAVDLLRHRKDIKLIYVHTTDYPMHMWSPLEAESKEHMSRLDELIGQARDTAPDAAFLITADHGMNYKKRCWDLARACAERGVPLRFALSAEKDRYVKHHRTFGGAGWVWLNSPSDERAVAETIAALEGVEEVITKEEAARRFHLMPARIGDLVVIGDRDTVFGELESAREELEPTYRSHGSLHESDVPAIVYNAAIELPPANAFKVNFDITRIPFGL
jgi:phosphonoacetate hydrolase